MLEGRKEGRKERKETKRERREKENSLEELKKNETATLPTRPPS